MAHGLQIMKMCEAFVKQGVNLELIVPKRFAISDLAKKDPFEYYKVDKNFKIKKLFCLDLTPLNRFLGPVSFLIQAISFAISGSLIRTRIRHRYSCLSRKALFCNSCNVRKESFSLLIFSKILFFTSVEPIKSPTASTA